MTTEKEIDDGNYGEIRRLEHHKGWNTTEVKLCKERHEIVEYYREKWNEGPDSDMCQVSFTEIVRIQTFNDILYLVVMEVPEYVDILVDLNKSDKTKHLRERLYMIASSGEYGYYRSQFGEKEKLEQAVKIMEEFVEKIQQMAWQD